MRLIDNSTSIRNFDKPRHSSVAVIFNYQTFNFQTIIVNSCSLLAFWTEINSFNILRKSQWREASSENSRRTFKAINLTQTLINFEFHINPFFPAKPKGDVNTGRILTQHWCAKKSIHVTWQPLYCNIVRIWNLYKVVQHVALKTISVLTPCYTYRFFVQQYCR